MDGDHGEAEHVSTANGDGNGHVDGSDHERPSKKPRTEAAQDSTGAAPETAADAARQVTHGQSEHAAGVVAASVEAVQPAGNTADATAAAAAAAAPTTADAAQQAEAVSHGTAAPEAQVGADSVKAGDAPPAVAAGALPSTPSKAPTASQGTQDAAPSPAQHRKRSGDVVYRVLVPHRVVGIVIGKGGCTVREIQSTTGARVQVATAVPTCEEHVVVVSMPEDPEVEVHGAEQALVALQRLLILEQEPTAAAALDDIQQAQEKGVEGPHAASHGPAAPAGEASTPTEPGATAAETGAQQPNDDQPAAGGVGDMTDAAAAAAAAGTEAARADTAGEAAAAAAADTPDVVAVPQQAAGAGPAAGDDQHEGAAGGAQAGHTAEAACAGKTDAAGAAQQQPSSPGAAGAAGAPDAGDGATEGAPGLAAAEPPTGPEPTAAAAAAADSSIEAKAGASGPTTAPPATDAAPNGMPAVTTPTAAAGPSHPSGSPGHAAQPSLSPVAPRMQHSARLLLGHSQSLSLLAHGAAALKGIKEGSGARLQVHFPEDSPLCALEGDRVAQLSGRPEAVMQGLRLLARHLRQHPPLEKPGGMHPELAARIAAARRPPPPPPPPRGYMPPGGYGGPAPAPGHYPGSYGVPGYGY